MSTRLVLSQVVAEMQLTIKEMEEMPKCEDAKHTIQHLTECISMINSKLDTLQKWECITRMDNEREWYCLFLPPQADDATRTKCQTIARYCSERRPTEEGYHKEYNTKKDLWEVWRDVSGPIDDFSEILATVNTETRADWLIAHLEKEQQEN